ncbi:slipin family protein [Gordonia sp. NPDC003376]
MSFAFALQPKRKLFSHQEIEPGHTVLEYRGGRLSRTLTPGRHRVRRTASYVDVDLRTHIVPVAPQEVLTADTVSVRVTMALRARVTDAVAYTETTADPWSAVYLAAQVALRDACASSTVEQLLARDQSVDADSILQAARTTGATMGIDVEAVFLKDVIVPSEIRSAALELITATMQGQARLEKARAETAALRALANAGRLLDAHPALARLRLVQEAPYGAKVVLAIGDADAAAGRPATSDGTR